MYNIYYDFENEIMFTNTSQFDISLKLTSAWRKEVVKTFYNPHCEASIGQGSNPPSLRGA